MKKVMSSKTSVIVFPSFVLLKLAGVRGLQTSTGRLRATRSLFRSGRKSSASNFRTSLLSMYFNMLRMGVAEALGVMCVCTYNARKM
jgi:hypothetical protein